MSFVEAFGWPAAAPITPTSTPDPGYGAQGRQQPAQGSPLWWVNRLEQKLRNRRGKIDTYSDYYDGKHPLAFASEKFRKAFGGLFEEFADNWCPLVVDASAERLKPQGFRYGPMGTGGDADAWRIYQANNLDSAVHMGITEALITAEAAAIVWANPATPDIPLITIEHPSQVYVEYVAGSRVQRAAALKLWTDDDGDLATLYLPDAIYKFRARRRAESRLQVVGDPGSRWVPREAASEPWPLPNPLGVVPVVPLQNRPRLLVPAKSELHNVLPIQDGVNKLVADLLVASEYSAFRQRWVTGMDIPVDPETKQPIEAFRPAVDRMFQAESADTTFGEFGITDLNNFKAGIELLVQHVASQTRTPPHYFYLSGQFPSGESIKSAETGLVAKVRDKMIHFGEALEEIMRLSFAVLGDPRAEVSDSETIWGDPESRSEAEHIDAVIKKRAIGVPLRQLWEDAGYSQAQIARFAEMLAEEATWKLPADVTGEAIGINA